MKRMLIGLMLVLVVAVSAYAASNPGPRQVTMKGQMVCLMCDCVKGCMPNVQAAPRSCMAVFKADSGKVYTLAPTVPAADLLNIKMHEQRVEIVGSVVPDSMILNVVSYKVIGGTAPKTPELPENWQMGYF